MADDTYAGRGINRIWCGGNKYDDIGVCEGTLKPGQPVIKGTSANQITQAAEDALNVLGIAEVQDTKDIDTAITAGTDVHFYPLGLGSFCYCVIQANIEDIVKGDKLTVAAESGKFRGHPDDLTIDIAGADTVTKDTFTGYREQPSYVTAWETLSKDASNDKIIKVKV